MSRCTVCGRIDECCDTCHQAFDSLYGPVLTTAQVREAKQAVGTISQFAGRVGAHRTAVSRWLSGETHPSEIPARRIVAILSEMGQG